MLFRSMYLDRLLARHRVPSHSNGFFPWATRPAPESERMPAPRRAEPAHPTRRRRKATKH